MIYLPDVNVWIAPAFQRHAHHAPAKTWFDRIPEDGCSFCRLTQQGFLRLATNPKALKQDAVSLAKAWRLYDAFLAAFAKAAVFEIATFDRGLAQYKGVRCVILS